MSQPDVSQPEHLVFITGKLARARALMARGQIDAAAVLAREVWRDEDFYQAYEPAILKDFGDYLTWDDDKRRSDRMFYKDNAGASARAAAYAGADVAAFASARASGNEKAIAALPPELLADPTLTFARARKLLRDNKPMEAAKAVFAAPKAAKDSVGGDEWWTLRRQIARKLLDLGDPRTAYRLCADGVAAARDQRIDEEFHAGWIALRFLADPATAAARFAAAEPLAITPISAARIAYWRGRAAEASGQRDKPPEPRRRRRAATRVLAARDYRRRSKASRPRPRRSRHRTAARAPTRPPPFHRVVWQAPAATSRKAPKLRKRWEYGNAARFQADPRRPSPRRHTGSRRWETRPCAAFSSPNPEVPEDQTHVARLGLRNAYNAVAGYRATPFPTGREGLSTADT